MCIEKEVYKKLLSDDAQQFFLRVYVSEVPKCILKLKINRQPLDVHWLSKNVTFSKNSGSYVR